MKNGWGIVGWRVKNRLRVKSRGSRIEKLEFTFDFIIVGVSDFFLQKFHPSIFVTEGLLKNIIPLGRSFTLSD